MAETHLGEEIHADQHLYEVVDDQCLLKLIWFAVLHEAWAPRVDKVEVETDDREPRHGRFDKRPVICPGICGEITKLYSLALSTVTAGSIKGVKHADHCFITELCEIFQHAPNFYANWPFGNHLQTR